MNGKWIAAAAILVLDMGMSGSRAMAQQANDPRTFDDLRARMQQQETEIRQLQAQLAEIPRAPATTPTAYATADGAPAAPAAPSGDPQKAPEGYVIGSDLSVKASFKDGLFPWLETPNKDFTLHIGCWVQWDNVWWDQSAALKAGKDGFAGPPGVASGNSLGGIGDLQDGVYFRRIRPNFEGTFWETGEYRFIPAFENNQFNTAGIDEMWVGAKNIPFIGTIRVGHVKNALGLEGDMNSSSRCMTFMERSSYSEAIELNQNFVTGLQLARTYFDDRMTSNFVIFRPDLKSSTDAFFGDGQSGVQARFTGLPFYEDEGRHLLHLGVSGGWRDGTNNLATSPIHTIELSARPELRDDVPAKGFTNGDPNAMVDTGLIASKQEYLMGLEAMYIRGPFSVQAEYGWNWIDNATGIAPTGLTFHPPLAPPQNYMFNGGYIQLAYTLTGENRGYDKRFGTLSREYFGKTGPFNNAWIVRDEDGNLIWNKGAWEVAARYSYVDLNDGTGANRIQGGIMDGVSLGLNWYLNPNLTANFEWVYDNRYDLPTGSLPGHTSGFGSRVQFQF
jgi:phosphate-selective porin OprO/OprP